MFVELPTGAEDGADECAGLSAAPLAEEDVLVLLPALAADEPEPLDGEGAAAAEKKKKPRDKAALRAELAEGDPYRLLELDELRWRATADDIRKAYRRLVLRYHPDKQRSDEGGGGGAADAADVTEALLAGGEDEEDAMFKAITGAFERLSDPRKRREFDSLDEFDDSIPSFDAGTDDFQATFAPVFERNARWSETQPAPLLGGADAPFDDVAAFYNFWFDFRSWRDFADADEYDISDASFREEKRCAPC